MRSLLDVNVLIALLQPDHVHHVSAQHWWSANQSDGWASCPLTQNGFLRIVPQLSSPRPMPFVGLLEILAEEIAQTNHQFWPDDLSLLDTALFNRDCIFGPKQLTDIYLLALAVKNNGRLATLDRTIPLGAVRGAEPRHVAVI